MKKVGKKLKRKKYVYLVYWAPPLIESIEDDNIPSYIVYCDRTYDYGNTIYMFFEDIGELDVFFCDKTKHMLGSKDRDGWQRFLWNCCI